MFSQVSAVLLLVFAQWTAALAFDDNPFVVTIGQPYTVNFLCDAVSEAKIHTITKSPNLAQKVLQPRFTKRKRKRFCCYRNS
jgi:hypothetical protein